MFLSDHGLAQKRNSRHKQRRSTLCTWEKLQSRIGLFILRTLSNSEFFKSLSLDLCFVNIKSNWIQRLQPCRSSKSFPVTLSWLVLLQLLLPGSVTATCYTQVSRAITAALANTVFWKVVKFIRTLSSRLRFKACVFRYDPCVLALRPRVILLLVTMSFLTCCRFLLVTDAFLCSSPSSLFGVFWLWFSWVTPEGPERSVTCAWSWPCLGVTEPLWPFGTCRWKGCSLSATTAGIVISEM